MNTNDIHDESLYCFLEQFSYTNEEVQNDTDGENNLLNWQSIFNYLNNYFADYIGFKKDLRLVCSGEYEYSVFKAVPENNIVYMRTYIFAPYWLCNQILLHQFFHNTDDDLDFSFNNYFE